MISDQKLTVDTLATHIYDTEEALALGAVQMGADYLQQVLKEKSEATLLLATGNSQRQFLESLITIPEIDWSRLRLLHLDEYLGIDGNSPASFRFYLHERVEKHVHPKEFHYLNGDALEPLAECDRYTQLLQAQPIDLCCLGVGVNGHLAFNEPQVANFRDPYWVKLVRLDQQTRWMQVYQGHFRYFETVPQYAFTVTIPTILSSRKIICLAPGEQKAEIIKEMLRGSISKNCPASVLRQHPDATLCLDKESAQLL